MIQVTLLEKQKNILDELEDVLEDSEDVSEISLGTTEESKEVLSSSEIDSILAALGQQLGQQELVIEDQDVATTSGFDDSGIEKAYEAYKRVKTKLYSKNNESGKELKDSKKEDLYILSQEEIDNLVKKLTKKHEEEKKSENEVKIEELLEKVSKQREKEESFNLVKNKQEKINSILWDIAERYKSQLSQFERDILFGKDKI